VFELTSDNDLIEHDLKVSEAFVTKQLETSRRAFEHKAVDSNDHLWNSQDQDAQALFGAFKDFAEKHGFLGPGTCFSSFCHLRPGICPLLLETAPRFTKIVSLVIFPQPVGEVFVLGPPVPRRNRTRSHARGVAACLLLPQGCELELTDAGPTPAHIVQLFQ
jgi:hypothetical protein